MIPFKLLKEALNKFQISMLFRTTKLFLLIFFVPALGIYSQDPGLVSGASDRASTGETKIGIRQAQASPILSKARHQELLLLLLLCSDVVKKRGFLPST